MRHRAHARDRPRACAAGLDFSPRRPALWDRLTVRENLAVYAGLCALAHAERAVDHVLDSFELRDSAR